MPNSSHDIIMALDISSWTPWLSTIYHLLKVVFMVFVERTERKPEKKVVLFAHVKGVLNFTHFLFVRHALRSFPN